MTSGVREPARKADAETVQRRTVTTLITSQVVGGLGVSGGIAVGALLATEVLSSEDLAGFAQSAQVLGAALLALPAARLSVAFGRRVGLGFAYSLGVIGGVLAVVAGQIESFPLLLVGTALFGGGTAAGLQARFAATDLAPAAKRARTLSVVVWATTIGAVVGPNLVGPAGALAREIGLEPLTGPFLLGAVFLVLASLVVTFGLRPDPLVVARSLRTVPEPVRRHGVIRHGLAAVSQSPRAKLGLAAIVIAHTVMVSVMVMTPIHMQHGHASLELIGLVISVHVAGMFAFSPVMGWLTDRIGRVPVIAGGGVTLLVAVTLAGTAQEGHSAELTAGLFLLGLGWSACLVAGSTLVTEGVPGADRPAAQGASDLLMGLSAAAGGAVAGLVVGTLGYGVLNAMASVLALALLAATAHPSVRSNGGTSAATRAD
ncbi:MAG TPA: MFS transporter [Jiangellaceae bacterium]|jgi:MFS family permease|nr:MFS transporter [Jiangellaceae bacterium]